jgi:hypothetical protein
MSHAIGPTPRRPDGSAGPARWSQADFPTPRAVRWLDQQDVRRDQLDGLDQDLPRRFDGLGRTALQQRTQRLGEQRPQHIPRRRRVRGAVALPAGHVRQDLRSHVGEVEEGFGEICGWLAFHDGLMRRERDDLAPRGGALP